MGRGRGFKLVSRANSSFGKLLVGVVSHSRVSAGRSCPALAASSWKTSGALGAVRGWSHLPVSSPKRGQDSAGHNPLILVHTFLDTSFVLG